MLRQAQHERSWWALALVLLLFAPTTPAAAQTPAQPTTYDRAIAAGYKALTLCSAIFDAETVGANRTEESVEANELKGIYPEYDALLPALASTIDRARDRVLVPYDPQMPARIAEANYWAGCTILPIGSAQSATVRTDVVVGGPDRQAKSLPWPSGDDHIPAATIKSLEQPISSAFGPAYGAASNTTAVVVTRQGRLIAERYAAGFGRETPQRTWSVAKSLSGTLIGIAAAHGAIDPAKSALVPEWQAPGDPRATITLDNLMRMASGLHSGAAGNRTDAIYFGGTAVTEQAVAWPLEAPPGTRFRYANDDILIAVRALISKADPAIREFLPDTTLFGPLGMYHTIAERDWRGNYILSSQVWSTARDLARFGQFYLQDGVWRGQRLLPTGWVKYVTTPSGPQPEGEFGYGATFWLLNKSPGVPADTFAAIGNRGQYVVIVPSRQVVIVRRGEDPNGAKFDIAQFTADVLAALK